jgi:hypothetical protein
MLHFTYAVLSETKYTDSSVGDLSEPADIHLAGQEIPRLLWNLKVHYVFTRARHRSLTWARFIQFHTFPPNIPKIYSNIIFLSTLTAMIAQSV